MPRKAKLPVESSGAVVEETPPSATLSDVSTPDTGTSGAGCLAISMDSVLESTSTTNAPSTPSVAETPEPPVFARLRQKAEEEAVNGSGGPKGPHPYEYTIDNAGLVPAAFRDESYNISDELIQAHFQDAYDHGRNPVVSGLMIGMKQ